MNLLIKFWWIYWWYFDEFWLIYWWYFDEFIETILINSLIKFWWIYWWYFNKFVDDILTISLMIFNEFKVDFQPPVVSEKQATIIYWFSISLYLAIDESSGARVFEIGFSWLSAFQFGAFCVISTPRTRGVIKSNQHCRSIDLVEISRSVVKSSQMDPSTSKYDGFQFSLIYLWSFD